MPPPDKQLLTKGDDVALKSWAVGQGALPHDPFLALLAGDCSDCTDYRSLTRGLPSNIVLVFRAPAPSKVKFPRSHAVTFAPNDIYDRMNPFGVPRLALISGKGKIIDIQSVEDSPSVFLQRCDQ